MLWERFKYEDKDWVCRKPFAGSDALADHSGRRDHRRANYVITSFLGVNMSKPLKMTSDGFVTTNGTTKLTASPVDGENTNGSDAGKSSAAPGAAPVKQSATKPEDISSPHELTAYVCSLCELSLISTILMNECRHFNLVPLDGTRSRLCFPSSKLASTICPRRS